MQVMLQEAEIHTREACTMALKDGGEQYREWLKEPAASRVGQLHARVREKPCELEHPARYSDPPTYIAAKREHWAQVWQEQHADHAPIACRNEGGAAL